LIVAHGCCMLVNVDCSSSLNMDAYEDFFLIFHDQSIVHGDAQTCKIMGWKLCKYMLIDVARYWKWPRIFSTKTEWWKWMIVVDWNIICKELISSGGWCSTEKKNMQIIYWLLGDDGVQMKKKIWK